MHTRDLARATEHFSIIDFHFISPPSHTHPLTLIGAAVSSQSRIENTISLAEAGDKVTFEVELRDFFGNLRSAQEFQGVDGGLLQFNIRLELHDGYMGFDSEPAEFGVREYCSCCLGLFFSFVPVLHGCQYSTPDHAPIRVSWTCRTWTKVQCVVSWKPYFCGTQENFNSAMNSFNYSLYLQRQAFVTYTMIDP